MKETIIMILGLVLVNNYALTAYLGLSPLLGFAGGRRKILALGLCVTGVTLPAAVVMWLLRGLIPPYLRILVTVVVVLALVYLLQLVLGKRLGVWFPAIALNAAVFAAVIRACELDSLLTAVLSALGVGLGFLLGLFLLSGVSEKIEQEHLPKAFRGLPIQILAAAIVALALSAFNFK